MSRPVIFISHSHQDKQLARHIKLQLENCIPTHEAFASDIDAGENWFDTVMGKLDNAEAIVVLITPNSVSMSHWVWFELGYFWGKHPNDIRTRSRAYYPIFVQDTKLPSPIHDLQIQAMCINERDELSRFFSSITKSLGGDVTKLDMSEIIKQAEKTKHYSSPNSKSSESKYVSRYEGYSDDELLMVISQILEDEFSIYERIPSPHREDHDEALLVFDILNSRLIHFRDIDAMYNLPHGTSFQFLKVSVAILFPAYSVMFDDSNTIKFAEKVDNVDEIPF
jgi:hypothetical protein